jgi:hypothetical protein
MKDTRSSRIARILLCMVSGALLIVLVAACGGSTSSSSSTTNSGSSTTSNSTSTSKTPNQTPTATQQTNPNQQTTTNGDSGLEGIDNLPFKVPTDGVLMVKFSCGGTRGDGVQVNDSQAKVCVKTQPGANLKIQVNFCRGNADPSQELQGTFKADANGFYQWNWKPQADCNGQSIWGWKTTVNAELNGQTATATTEQSNQ